MYVLRSGKSYRPLYLTNVSHEGMSSWTRELENAKIYESIGHLLADVEGIDDVTKPQISNHWEIARVAHTGLQEVETL